MSRARPFLADTAAMLTFFTLLGVLNERLVAGMAWDEVLRARLIGAAAMVPTARPYGLWRDAALPRLAGREPGRLRLLLADTATLLSFQLPLYAAILLAGGAEAQEVLRGVAGASVVMTASGRPYGLWLDVVRRWAGVRAGP
jgi:hypothetical protein